MWDEPHRRELLRVACSNCGSAADCVGLNDKGARGVGGNKIMKVDRKRKRPGRARLRSSERRSVQDQAGRKLRGPLTR